MTATPEGRRAVQERFLQLLKRQYPGFSFHPVRDDKEPAEGVIRISLRDVWDRGWPHITRNGLVYRDEVPDAPEPTPPSAPDDDFAYQLDDRVRVSHKSGDRFGIIINRRVHPDLGRRYLIRWDDRDYPSWRDEKVIDPVRRADASDRPTGSSRTGAPKRTARTSGGTPDPPPASSAAPRRAARAADQGRTQLPPRNTDTD